MIKTRIAICTISCNGSDSLEAVVLRSILENFGATVDLHMCGTPQGFLDVISQGAGAPPYMILAGHGDDVGLCIGAFADFIDTNMLVDEVMPINTFARALNLPNTVVVSTACSSGTDTYKAAINREDVVAYIAPDGDPEHGSDSLFVHRLFYGLIVEKLVLIDALSAARNVCDDAMMYKNLMPAN